MPGDLTLMDTKSRLIKLMLRYKRLAKKSSSIDGIDLYMQTNINLVDVMANTVRSMLQQSKFFRNIFEKHIKLGKGPITALRESIPVTKKYHINI